jgi:hypothetical protein
MANPAILRGHKEDELVQRFMDYGATPHRRHPDVAAPWARFVPPAPFSRAAAGQAQRIPINRCQTHSET